MKVFLQFAAVLALLCVTTGKLPAKELKVLMIGNSFSVCVGKYLPAIVSAEKKHKLELTSAYIGGCALNKHYAKLQEAEKNPEVKPYKISVWNSAVNPASKDARVTYGNINNLLKNNQYDIITIQQASRYSFDPATYHPLSLIHI